MAGTYKGIFLRHFFGQQDPYETGAGWTDSPDIITYGMYASKEPKEFVTNYNNNTYTNKVYFDVSNFIYIRGKNTNDGAQDARIWFYCTESDFILWPQNWSEAYITANGKTCNYIDVHAQNNGDIVVTVPSFIWISKQFHSGHSQGDHYCLIAIAENNPVNPPVNPKPKGAFNSFNDIANLIQSSPNMAWKNTQDINLSGTIIESQLPMSGSSAGGVIHIGVEFEKMPCDPGDKFYERLYFDLIVPGPDSSHSVNKINIPVQNDASINYKVNWPANFNSTCVFRIKAYSDNLERNPNAQLVNINAADLAGATAFPNIIMPRATSSSNNNMCKIKNNKRKPTLMAYSDSLPSDYVMIGSIKLNYV